MGGSKFQRIRHSVVLLAGLILLASPLHGDEPEWIWSPRTTALASQGQPGECYFRKKFTLIGPQQAEVTFTAGDEYEIYLNNRLVGRGQSFGQTRTLDVSEFIEPGVNLLAVRIRHHESPRAGLALKFRVKEEGETRWRSLSTDGSWRTRIAGISGWTKNAYNDMGWLRAQVVPETEVAVQTMPSVQVAAIPEVSPAAPPALPRITSSAEQPSALSSRGVHSRLGDLPESPATDIALAAPVETEPATTTPAAVDVAAAPPTEVPQTAEAPPQVQEKPFNAAERFEIDPRFQVDLVMSSDETGSLIALEFNEFGQLLLSREGGPLMIADLTVPQDDPERIRVYCDEVNTCQGILPLNGDVYVTGQGPQGLGLYRLTDENRDGIAEVAQKLLGFTGILGEHGPHGIQFGPDGMLYVVVGNNSQVEGPLAASSPYRDFYEGDLIPRYEDPGGHAQGVQAPGGTIVRVSLDGSKIERFAGGLRNAYDLVVDSQGEVFIHDSDMESDMGTSWYRPTQLYHVPAGAELGWRSGWAKFPQYAIDQTPALASTGRGSPSGAVLYQHLQFPAEYQNTLFLADWSEGRILATRLEHQGAGFAATTETFLQGRPLNVCDITVGEDGGLYFCTGGRGTAGGVFRVIYTGEIDPKLIEFDSDLARVLRQPQPNSAWARQNLAELRQSLGDQWGPSLAAVAREARNSLRIRRRALQLMVLFGPAPDDELLQTLAADPAPEIRAEIARLGGVGQTEICRQLVTQLLGDTHPYVRRKAAESILQIGLQPELEQVLPLLSSLDPHEALIGRRLLERLPVETWETAVLESEDVRILVNGSVSLMTAAPSLPRAYQVLARCSVVMDGFVNDRDFVDILRTIQLALIRGEVDATKVTGLTERMVHEFPAANSQINLELARILGYLQGGNFSGRLETFLQDEEVSTADKVHVAMFLIAGSPQLTAEERLAIVDALESARRVTGGGSFDGYVRRALEGIASRVTEDDILTVLKNGDRWPKTVLTAFYRLPEDIETETMDAVIEMDQRIRAQETTDAAAEQVRLGVIAILARDGDPRAMDYLRQSWQQEPQRRNDIVIGLAQQPAGDNWAYLVGSLSLLDDLTSIEVLEKLTAIPRKPRDPIHYRELIELGYRLRGRGAEAAISLLEHWTGETTEPDAAGWQARLDAWRAWYGQQWPEEADVTVTTSTEQPQGAYSVAQLWDQLDQQGLGSAHRGREIFRQAQCATCHRGGDLGTAVGPDLTNLGNRFSLREVLEATLQPSAVIPDRYASQTVATVDGRVITGLAIAQPDEGYLIVQPDGQRVRVSQEDIEAIQASPESVMPAGLLDSLSLQEVADLMAFLMRTPAVSVADESAAGETSEATTR